MYGRPNIYDWLGMAAVLIAIGVGIGALVF